MKRSTCNKINPIIDWFMVVSLVLKCVYDIWERVPIKIEEDV